MYFEFLKFEASNKPNHENKPTMKNKIKLTKLNLHLTR